MTADTARRTNSRDGVNDMGLSKSAIALLMEESKRQGFSGSVATLGKQDVYIGAEQLQKLSIEHEFKLSSSADPSGDTLSDESLLRTLGFDEVVSIDHSNFENATVIFDFNNPVSDESLKNKFDVVIDSGTIEHIFHVPNVLNNIFTLLKPGGRIIHLTPSSNHIDHGFYMFSPTLFEDFYRSNNFEVNTSYVFRYDVYSTKKWDIFDSTPGRWNELSMGGLDGESYGVYFVATKTPSSTENVVPQQNYYQHAWASENNGGVDRRSAIRKIAGYVPVAKLTFRALRAILWKLQKRGPAGIRARMRI
jgi:SAM-dependent methyltransferase